MKTNFHLAPEPPFPRSAFDQPRPRSSLTVQPNCASPHARPMVFLVSTGGLHIEIPVSGTKRRRLKYRFEGKEKRCAS